MLKKKIILKLFINNVVSLTSKCPLMKFTVSFQTGNVLKMTSVGHGEKFTF